jgi:hypothetical protein
MHVDIKRSGYLHIFWTPILCLCIVGSTIRRHVWRWRDSDSYKNLWLLDFVSISFPLFGFVLNVPVFNHRPISTKFNDNICTCLTQTRHVYSTESLQAADENLETVLSVPYSAIIIVPCVHTLHPGLVEWEGRQCSFLDYSSWESSSQKRSEVLKLWTRFFLKYSISRCNVLV